MKSLSSWASPDWFLSGSIFFCSLQRRGSSVKTLAPCFELQPTPLQQNNQHSCSPSQGKRSLCSEHPTALWESGWHRTWQTGFEVNRFDLMTLGVCLPIACAGFVFFFGLLSWDPCDSRASGQAAGNWSSFTGALLRGTGSSLGEGALPEWNLSGV